MGFLGWLFDRSIEKRFEKFREDRAKSPWDGAACYRCGDRNQVVWRDIEGELRPICISCDPFRNAEKS